MAGCVAPTGGRKNDEEPDYDRDQNYRLSCAVRKNLRTFEQANHDTAQTRHCVVQQSDSPAARA